MLVTENVVFDILGYCYYLEDGVEEENTLSLYLVVFFHFLGEAPWGCRTDNSDKKSKLHLLQGQLMSLLQVSKSQIFETL